MKGRRPESGIGRNRTKVVGSCPVEQLKVAQHYRYGRNGLLRDTRHPSFLADRARIRRLVASIEGCWPNLSGCRRAIRRVRSRVVLAVDANDVDHRIDHHDGRRHGRRCFFGGRRLRRLVGDPHRPRGDRLRLERAGRAPTGRRPRCCEPARCRTQPSEPRGAYLEHRFAKPERRDRERSPTRPLALGDTGANRRGGRVSRAEGISRAIRSARRRGAPSSTRAQSSLGGRQSASSIRPGAGQNDVSAFPPADAPGHLQGAPRRVSTGHEALFAVLQAVSRANGVLSRVCLEAKAADRRHASPRPEGEASGCGPPRGTPLRVGLVPHVSQLRLAGPSGYGRRPVLANGISSGSESRHDAILRFWSGGPK